MDSDALSGKIFLIIAIIGLIFLLQFIPTKGRRAAVTRREIVRSLLIEVRLNQALAETFNRRQEPKKFEVVSWKRTKTHLDFLGQSLRSALSETFTIVEDFNQQIAAAKKSKSTDYLANINIDKLKEPLAKSRQGLEQWLLINTGSKQPPTEYPGTIDSLFGGRGY